MVSVRAGEDHFLLPRHRMSATNYRAERTRAFQAWHGVCGITQAA
jgi:putative transposase